MPKRPRSGGRGTRLWLLTLLVVFLPSLCRAETTATVTLDATATSGEPSSYVTPDALRAWVRWAGMEEGAPLAPTIVPASALAGRAVRFRGGLGVLLTNTADEPVHVRVEVTVPTGLWRVDAAIVGEAEARAWRMESVLRPQPGPVSKPVLLLPAHTLLLRITETVARAGSAYTAVVAAKDGADTDFLRGRVGRALAPVGGALKSLTALVGKGERAKIATKAHRALLAAAGAQALWKNGRSDEQAGHDGAFDDLMAALSEVSCAACNLVPTQTEIIGADGKRLLRVGVVNAGTRTVPLLSLGVREEAAFGAPPPDWKIYRGLAPGRQVSATFAAGDTPVRGVVQFILAMGAAVVPASPLP